MLALSATALAVAAPDILVVGGTGRVGASTTRWLADLTARAGTPAKLAVGGRSAPTDSQRSRLPQNTKFVEIDLDGGDARLREAVAGRSLVIHTAGPFQQRTDPALLRAASTCREWHALAASERVYRARQRCMALKASLTRASYAAFASA